MRMSRYNQSCIMSRTYHLALTASLHFGSRRRLVLRPYRRLRPNSRWKLAAAQHLFAPLTFAHGRRACVRIESILPQEQERRRLYYIKRIQGNLLAPSIRAFHRIPRLGEQTVVDGSRGGAEVAICSHCCLHHFYDRRRLVSSQEKSRAHLAYLVLRDNVTIVCFQMADKMVLEAVQDNRNKLHLARC